MICRLENIEFNKQGLSNVDLRIEIHRHNQTPSFLLARNERKLKNRTRVLRSLLGYLLSEEVQSD